MLKTSTHKIITDVFVASTAMIHCTSAPDLTLFKLCYNAKRGGPDRLGLAMGTVRRAGDADAEPGQDQTGCTQSVSNYEAKFPCPLKFGGKFTQERKSRTCGDIELLRPAEANERPFGVWST